MKKKEWYQSWTVWFNVVILVVDFVNQLVQVVPVPPGFLTALIAFGNLLLRFKTVSGLK